MFWKKKTASAPKKEKAEKLIGEVTHFFGGIEVAIVKCKAPIAVGDTLHFKGATTDFTLTVKSMQYDHKTIEKAKKGQEVGIKIDEKVRENDEVYSV